MGTRREQLGDWISTVPENPQVRPSSYLVLHVLEEVGDGQTFFVAAEVWWAIVAASDRIVNRDSVRTIIASCSNAIQGLVLGPGASYWYRGQIII